MLTGIKSAQMGRRDAIHCDGWLNISAYNAVMTDFDNVITASLSYSSAQHTFVLSELQFQRDTLVCVC